MLATTQHIAANVKEGGRVNEENNDTFNGWEGVRESNEEEEETPFFFMNGRE